MDEALVIGRIRAAIGDLTIHAEFHDVFVFDQLGAARTRQEEAVGLFGMAHAHMAKSVHDALACENTVGEHQFIDQRVEVSHGSFLIFMGVKDFQRAASMGLSQPRKRMRGSSLTRRR